MKSKQNFNKSSRLSSMKDTLTRQVKGLRIVLKSLTSVLVSKLRRGLRNLVQSLLNLLRKVTPSLTKQS